MMIDRDTNVDEVNRIELSTGNEVLSVKTFTDSVFVDALEIPLVVQRQ